MAKATKLATLTKIKLQKKRLNRRHLPECTNLCKAIRVKTKSNVLFTIMARDTIQMLHHQNRLDTLNHILTFISGNESTVFAKCHLIYPICTDNSNISSIEQDV